MIFSTTHTRVLAIFFANAFACGTGKRLHHPVQHTTLIAREMGDRKERFLRVSMSMWRPCPWPHGHGHLSIAARRRGITVAITPCAVAHLPLLQCTPPSPSPARLYLSRYPLPAPREPVHVLFPSSTRWAADSSWAVSSGAAHLDAHGDGGDERHAVLDGAVRGDERDRVRGVG